MVDAQFNFPFLQRLFLRAEIVNIRIRNVIGFTEEAVGASIDDSVGKRE